MENLMPDQWKSDEKACTLSAVITVFIGLYRSCIEGEIMSMAEKLMPIWLIALLLLEIPAQAAAFDKKPLIIAHRGASGYRPEHTLAAYQLAIDMGADFIEPDLVSTKDGQLVARHENEISGTTDVADHSEFANRKTTKVIDGESKKGWFTEDFTLAELKTLRARERLPEIRQRNTIYNDHYPIPTFQEIIDLVKKEEVRLHRPIGIYPEAKHPSYFQSVKLPIEKPLLEILNKNGYVDQSAPIFIQCFETAALKQLHKQTKISLIQLIDDTGKPYDFVVNKDPRTFADLVKPAGLAEVATYAQGIGPSKDLIVPRDKEGRWQAHTNVVSDAHKVGLKVHPWTFRNENSFLPLELRSGKPKDPNNAGMYGDIFAEYKLFFDLGVDGVFSENPDTALEARAIFEKG
jgi:glycerophosphoryl diester phosphodiesterase